jgi:hypothetical protein
VTGFYGQTGIQGVTGLWGLTGLALGATGIAGVTGAYGGPPGETGLQGQTGIQGATGLQSYSYGECYVSTPASTTLTTQSTYYLLQGTTTAGSYLQDFTHASPGRLTYTGSATKNFLVSAYVGASVGNAVEYALRLAKGGTTIVQSQNTIQPSLVSQHYVITTQGIIEMSTNDYIELYVACTARGTTTLTANNANIIIRSF